MNHSLRFQTGFILQHNENLHQFPTKFCVKYQLVHSETKSNKRREIHIKHIQFCWLAVVQGQSLKNLETTH